MSEAEQMRKWIDQWHAAQHKWKLEALAEGFVIRRADTDTSMRIWLEYFQAASVAWKLEHFHSNEQDLPITAWHAESLRPDGPTLDDMELLSDVFEYLPD